MRFKDKVVVVFGGNSGMGLATARAFAGEGAKVHLTGRNQETIDAAVASIPGSTGYRSDISSPEQSSAVISAVEAADGRIDVLFINAGIGGFWPLREITQDIWDEVHAINLRGCVFALQAGIRLMSRGGSIVVTGSNGAHAAVPGNAIYAAAKSGLHAAMKIFAKELAPEGIRLNMVSPGPIDTPLFYRNPGMSVEQADQLKDHLTTIIPLERMGQPDDVAKAVLYLASDDASFITAANLFIDGGMLELR